MKILLVYHTKNYGFDLMITLNGLIFTSLSFVSHLD